MLNMNKGIDTCEQGYFGSECEFVCHCYNGDGCDKATGACNNGKCAYRWGGEDCQQGMINLCFVVDIVSYISYKFYIVNS